MKSLLLVIPLTLLISCGGSSTPDTTSEKTPAPIPANSCIIDSTSLNLNANGIDDDIEHLQRAVSETTCPVEDILTIELPSGIILISKPFYVDRSNTIIKGEIDSEGKPATKITFHPADFLSYEFNTEKYKLSDMKAPKVGNSTPNAAWIGAGRGAIMVQHRDLINTLNDDKYYDFYYAESNQHWSDFNTITENIILTNKPSDMLTLNKIDNLSIGDDILLLAANSNKFYAKYGVQDIGSHRTKTPYIRQRMYEIKSIDEVNKTITLDKPLEFDVYINSTADGSALLADESEPTVSKIKKLSLVKNVTLKNIEISQISPNNTFPDKESVNHHYENLDIKKAFHNIVVQWARSINIENVTSNMTGGHSLISYTSRNIDIYNNTLSGAWNKGADGLGYVRLDRTWDSEFHDNTVEKLRHFTLQWSSSGNHIYNNDFSVDINLHGGLERFNLIYDNNVEIPFEHQENINTDERWFPIFIGTGFHAGDWSSATGEQNTFINNSLRYQQDQGAEYINYLYSDENRLYQFNWDNISDMGSEWAILSNNGSSAFKWPEMGLIDFTQAENSGVNANCSITGEIKNLEVVTCNGTESPKPAFFNRPIN